MTPTLGRLTGQVDQRAQGYLRDMHQRHAACMLHCRIQLLSTCSGAGCGELIPVSRNANAHQDGDDGQRNQALQQCESAQPMQTTSQAVSHEATLGAPAQRGNVTGKKRRFVLRVIALADCLTFLRTPERKIKLGDDTASMRSVFYRHGRNTQTFGEGKSDVFFPAVEIPNGQSTVLTKGINDFLHQKFRRRGARSHPDTMLTR